MAASPGAGPRPRVAMLMWGDVVEDFLGGIGWTLDDMLARMTGGWFFGYIDALARCGVDTVPILVTKARGAPDTVMHAPSGARIRLIKSPAAYLALRRFVPSPYNGLYHGDYYAEHIARPLRPLNAMARDILPYLATPQRELARVIAEERCDVLLCQEYEEPRFDIAVSCGRALGIPVFATFQGATGWRSRREARERPVSIARAAGLVIGASRERHRVQQAYGVPDDKLGAINNPLDERLWFPERVPETRAELGIPGDAVVVAWHGRVEISMKGLDVLLDAWRAMERASHVRPHLLLIGSGTDADALRHRLTDAGAGVTWVDRYVAERAVMRRYLSCGDLYVLASRREGFPMAPLEAMACGLPVVTSDVNGVSDIVPGGEEDGGLTFPVGDAAGLARHLEVLLGDPDRRARMAANAVRRVHDAFHPLVVGQQLKEFMFPGSKNVTNQP